MTGGGWMTRGCCGAHPAANNMATTINDRNFTLRSLARLTARARRRYRCASIHTAMSDKKPDRILDDLQEEIEKLREEGELPEVLDIIRHIERASEKLKKAPTKNWIH